MKISFCLVKTPFPIGDLDYTIIFTKDLLDDVNLEICSDDHFLKIKKILNNWGYLEVEDLHFQFIGNKEEFLTKEELLLKLKSLGLDYNIELENKKQNEYDSLKTGITQEDMFSLFKNIINENEINPKKTKDLTKINLDDFPDIGDKINLNFYLVVDFFYNDDLKDIFVDINGSFLNSTKKNKSYRNVIKPLKEEFVRIESIDPNFVYLKSTKTKGELLKEISFLYEIVLNLVVKSGTSSKKMESKIFNYFDIRNKIKQDENIIIYLEFNDYIKMLETSTNIALNKNMIQSQFIDAEEIELSIEDMLEFSEKIMNRLADQENYIEASQMKKDLKIMEEKYIQYKKEYNKKGMDIYQFHKYFNLK